ncbi:MAG: alpha/beta hydrolase, partial [Chitinophagales bacterium]
MTLLTCVIVFHLLTHGSTKKFYDAKNNEIRGSVALLKQFNIGNYKQWVLVRGEDTSKPVLLFLHGGPGMPSMFLAHQLYEKLEKEFIVVHWDRRGAGKSYSSKLDTNTINVKQLIADTRDLTDTLRRMFHKNKIILAGHSWGSYLGMIVAKEYPDLYYCYVGIAQLTGTGSNSEDVHTIQLHFISQEAMKRKDSATLKKLQNKKIDNTENYLFKYGGEVRGWTSFWPFLWIGLKAKEYTLQDALNVQKGSQFCQRHMVYNYSSNKLIDKIDSLTIPVYFFTGKYDYTDPFELTEQYFQKFKTQKKIIWFSNSAHFPFIEEKEKFFSEMMNIK